MRIVSRLGPIWAATALMAGCRSAPVKTSAPGEDAGVARAQRADPEPAAAASEPSFNLPAGWEALTDLAFERGLDVWLPAGESRRLAPSDLAALEIALEPADATAMRAAVLLARARDPQAGEVLLNRLEKRQAPPNAVSGGASERDAVDVVAAAAFAQGMPGREAAARLTGLAVGRRPHPDLAVRVECARSAIALGRDESIPFLLQVLRAGTTAGRVVPGSEREDELAWAQVRASEALSARAGMPCRFRPEASVREREVEAERLEGLLPRPREKR